MNKELAKTLTTALVQFIDRERPGGTMCCSNAECESIEKMFEGECYDIIEAFIQKKLSGMTEFEIGYLEHVFHQKPEDLDEENKEIFLEDARFVFNLAREQFIKDGYVIEKKAFHDAVKNVPPKVMKEVSDNVDKENPTKFEKFMDEVVDDAIRETYSKDGFRDICRDALSLAKEEILKDVPVWRTWKNGACGNSDNIPIAIVKRGINYKLVSTLGIQGEQYIMLSDLEKLPGFKED